MRAHTEGECRIESDFHKEVVCDDDYAVGQAYSRREKCSVSSIGAPIDQAKHEREQAELRDEIRGFHYDEAAGVWHILFRDQSQDMRRPEKQPHEARELKGSYKSSTARMK